MYSESDGKRKSPISLEEIQRIEKTQLSSAEKHYLRLMAHCLACFKLIANSSTSSAALPNRDSCLEWLLNDSGYTKVDEKFLQLLLNQFEVARNKLESLARLFKISPLQLTLEHLITSLEKDVSKD